MSERLTDKKRGFLGEPGNLISNVNGLSLNRFMREELGGLFQTQVKRFTPEGNVTVKGFGMYEKVTSEPIPTVGPQPYKTGEERLVILNARYYGEGWIWKSYLKLVKIETDRYMFTKELFDGLWWNSILNYDSYPFGASWDYEKKVFLMWASAGSSADHYLYEVSLDNEGIRVASYYETNGNWSDPRFFNSYGQGMEGVQNVMWIGTEARAYESDNGGFLYVLPLKDKYGFNNTKITNPDVVTEFIRESDCETYGEDNYILYKTHSGVSILSPGAGDATFNKYRLACDADGRIAYIYRENENSLYELRLCNKPWNKFIERTGNKKSVPAIYLNDYEKIWESSVYGGPEGILYYYSGGIQWEFGVPSGLEFSVSYDEPQWDVPSVGKVTIGYHAQWHEESGWHFSNGERAITYGTTADDVQIMYYTLDPHNSLSGYWVIDPAGRSHYVPGNLDPWHYYYDAVLVWNGNETSSSEIEPVTGLAYVNKHFCLMGGGPVYVNGYVFYYPLLRVLNVDGDEKYQIRLVDQIDATPDVLLNSLATEEIFISKGIVKSKDL